MRGRFFLLGALLQLGLVLPGWAAAGLPLLRQGPGARSAALAGAAAALADRDVLSANPAAFQPKGGPSLGVSHSEWVQEIRHEYLDLAASRPDRAWGVAALLWQTDGLERRTGPSVEPLGRFGVYEGALGLTHARSWTARLRLGAAAKVVRQAVYTETATGVAVDLGALYQVRPGLDLGAAVQNLGRMSALDQEATGLPRTWRAGAAYLPTHRLLVTGEVRRAAGAASAHLGGEFRAAGGLWVRGGYQSADTCPLTLGLGLRAHAWALDWAFLSFAQGLGEAHRLSLRLER